ncbi:hypothetical protein BJ878DRAFT_538257 [Calycina marina]|uniref:FYVE-type domain-containing protein n=1 Tax=Calycina marina TaxID=1763456 RepID=A0A9P7ZBT3_9HELO|nr:hypothetical protein BJ878DRAFT_538257 [Calycina marina]
MSTSGSAGSGRASPQAAYQGDRTSQNLILFGPDQVDGSTVSRHAEAESPLRRNQATGLARNSSSSSSISSLRRKRREDKRPEDIYQNRGVNVAQASYRYTQDGKVSDTESSGGRRVKTKYTSYFGERAGTSIGVGDSSKQPSTSSSSTHMAPSNEVGESATSSFDSTRHPPPPKTGIDEGRLTCWSMHGHSRNNYDISLAEALNLTDSRTSRDVPPSYSNTDPRYRGSTSSSGPENALPFVPGSSSPIRMSTIRDNNFVVPRWQSDVEVTFCPICKTQFSFFARKHHCRKCGRIVCNACSPHRITIPFQFIVQPPTAEPNPVSSQHRPSFDAARANSEFASLGGGERVRLCNPCVPDPNIAPPQTPSHESPRLPSHPNSHSRSASLALPTALGASATRSSNLPPLPPNFATSRPQPQQPSSLGRNRGEETIASRFHPDDSNFSIGTTRRPSVESPAVRSRSSTTVTSGYHQRPITDRDESRPLPRPPRIAEEDECPVCHRELPSSALPNSDTLRERHISQCIDNTLNPAATPVQLFTTSTGATQMGIHHASRQHASSSSSSGPPPQPVADTPVARAAARQAAHAQHVSQATSPPSNIRPNRILPYAATEKDSVDDAECTICLEEFEVGVQMGRLECLYFTFHLHQRSLLPFLNLPSPSITAAKQPTTTTMSASDTEATPLLSPVLHDLETQSDGIFEGDYSRKLRPRVIDWDERDRLLEPGTSSHGHSHGCSTGSLRETYVRHDDPALRPENLISVRVMQVFTISITVVSVFWLIVLLVSGFATPPGISFRGSGFFSCSFAALTLGLLTVGLTFLTLPSKLSRIIFCGIAGIMLVDLVIILIVPQIRIEEGLFGLAAVGWSVFVAIWLALEDELVRVFKDHQEARLMGDIETEHRRTFTEWGGVIVEACLLLALAAIGVLLTASMSLRARDTSLAPPGIRYLVDNKYQVHFYCQGNATLPNNVTVPTVLFETGYNTFEATMFRFAENAVKNGSVARYCFADRPGMAFSENAPSPFSAASYADVVTSILKETNETGPWVLASAGVGSIYSRVLSSRLGDSVKGLLLIEPLHEDLLKRIGSTDKSFMLWVLGVLSPLGYKNVPAAIFRGRTREDRVFGRSAPEDGKFIKAKLQESLVANSLTRDDVSNARAIQNETTPVILISSAQHMKDDHEWSLKQEDMRNLTRNMLYWDIVHGSPGDVWETFEGREIIERRLKELVLPIHI